MMNNYCLKCKKSTKDINSKGFVTKNKKYLVKSTYVIYVNLKNQNLYQNNMLKGSYQIYSVKYQY